MNLLFVHDHKFYKDNSIIYSSGSFPENIWDKGYDVLPQALKDYINFIEHEVDCPVKIVSVGPQRHETITR